MHFLVQSFQPCDLEPPLQYSLDVTALHPKSFPANHGPEVEAMGKDRRRAWQNRLESRLDPEDGGSGQFWNFSRGLWTSLGILYVTCVLIVLHVMCAQRK